MNNMQDTQEKPKTERESTRGAPVRPDVDIVETTDELVLSLDMPRVRPENVDISFESGELRISGRPKEHKVPASFLHQEFSGGDFYRAFSVSENIDPDHISAECRLGVLTVRLPKAKAARPRKITVNSR